MKTAWFQLSSARRVYGTVILSLAVFLFVEVAPAEAAPTIVGAVEVVDSAGVVSGWAMDVSDPSRTITIQIYLDGAPGRGGKLIGEARTGMPRQDLPSPGPYGFRFSIPSQNRDGQSHILYFLAKAASAYIWDDVLLAGSPQSFLLNSTIVRLDNGIVQIGIEPRCGGTLAELMIQGQNLINNADCTGRQLQAALYDGNGTYDNCAGCSGNWGWDPVQGGDRWNFGSPVLALEVTADLIYVKTRPYEWFPDNKGGGPGRPVLSDVEIEQWVSFVPGHPTAVRVRYRITHLGSDSHANAPQEFPATYVNRGYDNLVYYAGTEPWTGAPVTSTVLPAMGEATRPQYGSEQWAALLNAEGFGLSIYVPQQYSYFSGFQAPGTTGDYGSGANYLLPHVPFTFGPNAVLEGDVYAIAGPYQAARATVAALRDEHRSDRVPPFGSLDAPMAGATLAGTVAVSGWALDNRQVARVDVLVDGIAVGTARYGSARADVATVWPNAPTNVGFSAMWDTTRHANGLHTVTVRTVDESGNVSVFRHATVSVNNPAPQTPSTATPSPTEPDSTPEADTMPPTVSIGRIALHGQTLTVSVAATDNVRISRVELDLDGRLVATDGDSPYTYSVNVKSVPGGTHALRARAYDSAGNVGASTVVSWTKRK